MGENAAALRAAVFSLAPKKLRGGGGRSNAPPPAGRGLKCKLKIFLKRSLLLFIIARIRIIARTKSKARVSRLLAA